MVKKVFTINYNEYTVSDIVIPANTKCNTVEITNNPWGNDIFSSVSNNNGDLNILSDKTEHIIIIKDYFTKNGKHPIKYIEGLTLFDKNTTLLEYVNFKLYSNDNSFNIEGKNNKYIGTAFSDNITGTQSSEKIYGNGGIDKIYGLQGNDYIEGGDDGDIIFGGDDDDTIKGGTGADSLNGDNGNDIIYGNDGNDTIDGGGGCDTLSGGSGRNIIKLSATEDFGDDTVILTKGENLVFMLDKNSTDYADWHLDNDDLIIEVFSSTEQAEQTPENKKGSVRIKNYAKKDIMTGTGSLSLDDSSENNSYINLRSSISKQVIMNNDNYKNSSYKGGWVNDIVYAQNYTATDKKGNEITTETLNYEKVKGVTISLGGSSDDTEGNRVRGSIYADTIKGGAGADFIAGGKGNDNLTGQKGYNRYFYEKGDGSDIINITKDENMEIKLVNLKNDAMLAYTNKNKDLKIYYNDSNGTEAGAITLKGYAQKDITSEATLSFSDYNALSNAYETLGPVNIKDLTVTTNTIKNFTGTWMKDVISATDYKIYKDKSKTIISTEYAKKRLNFKRSRGR